MHRCDWLYRLAHLINAEVSIKFLILCLFVINDYIYCLIVTPSTFFFISAHEPGCDTAVSHYYNCHCAKNKLSWCHCLNCCVTFLQVKTKVYLEYVKAVGPVLSVFICFLYGCQSAASIGGNIWLSEWTNDASTNQTQENVHLRVGVYAALGIAQGEKHI